LRTAAIFPRFSALLRARSISSFDVVSSGILVPRRFCGCTLDSVMLVLPEVPTPPVPPCGGVTPLVVCELPPVGRLVTKLVPPELVVKLVPPVPCVNR